MKNKIVFVTGASRGIGVAIAEWFLKNRYRVVLGFKSNKGFSENPILLSDKMTICLDVSSRASIRKALNDVKSHFGGTVDILVNNAGIAQEKNFFDITDTDWDQMLATNLRGAFSLTQEILPGMIKNNWGRVINISSIGGQWGGENQIHYAASKAGLINLTMSIAKNYSKFGVTCNAIAPGLVKTDMSSREILSEEGQKKILSIPMGRVGTKEEIAATVGFLASSDASYITGQTINVNGGMFFG